MPKLTKRLVDSLELRAGEYFVADSELRGFGVRVAPSGRKTFALRYRVNGAQRRFKLGVYGPMTVDSARRRARQVLGEVAAGADPSLERRRKIEDPTVGELADRYLSDYAEPRKKTAEADRSMLKNHVRPRLGRLKLSHVTRRDVLETHRAISQTAPVQANRVLALVARMFNLAILWDLRADNPATGVLRNPEKRRETFLSGEQLAALGKALREAEETGTESVYAIAAIRLLLFTGCRRDEILTLTWDEVDFERGVLKLEDSKTGARVVQLNAPAIAILAALQARDDRDAESSWVIRGRHTGKRLVGIHRPWERIRDAAGLSGVRLHDLRHTHASVAAQRGESLVVIGSLLGHRVPATTARYAHLSDDPRRVASERTASDIAAAMDADPDEVAPAIPLRR